MSIPFLHELFPEATVVVITRHPVQVAASHLDQPWAPSTLEDVLNWLEPVYRRWLAQRAALLDDPRYVEVKAESLAIRWPASRPALFERLGLPDADNTSSFTASHLNRCDGQLDTGQRSQVIARLRWAAEELGYQPEPEPAAP